MSHANEKPVPSTFPDAVPGNVDWTDGSRGGRSASASRNAADVRQAMTSEFNRLSALKANWDSFGAPPIDKNIIEAAATFIQALGDNIQLRPHVAPMSTGALQLEWHNGSKIVELEFETPSTIRFLQWDSNKGIEVEDTFPVGDIKKAVDLIQWVTLGTSA